MHLFPRLWIATFMCLVIAFSAKAQGIDEDKARALKEFVASLNMKENWPEMVRSFSSEGASLLRQGAIAKSQEIPNLSEADRARAMQAFDEILPEFNNDMAKAFDSIDAQGLMEEVAFSVYAKYFSTAELLEISAFYRSATGKKLLRLTPTLVNESRRMGEGNAMRRYFTAAELNEIVIFYQSKGARRMGSTSVQVKQEFRTIYDSRIKAFTAPVVAKHTARLAQAINSKLQK